MEFYKDRVYMKDPKDNFKVIAVEVVDERWKLVKLNRFFRNCPIKGSHGLPHGAHGEHHGEHSWHEKDHHVENDDGLVFVLMVWLMAHMAYIMVSIVGMR